MGQTVTSEGTTGITSAVFRQVMGRWVTGVSVVTVRHGAEVRGVTVNSFTSVSLDPPLVLICLDKRSRSHDFISESGHFCVNVLDEHQQALSDQFAGRRISEPLDLVECSQAVTASGAPILAGCLAYLSCRVVATHEAGDHTIFLGLVEDAHIDGEGNPLAFFKGRYTGVLNGQHQ